MMRLVKVASLAAIIGISLLQLWQREEEAMLGVLIVVLGLLLLFTGISVLLGARRSSMAEEISLRTETWWWMVAVLMLAFSTHRIVSFVFLGFLRVTAPREYFKSGIGQLVLEFPEIPLILVALRGIERTLPKNDFLPVPF